MPAATSTQDLTALLEAYQNAERAYGKAVADVVAAEIKRDESLRAKDEAYSQLEAARRKFSEESLHNSSSHMNAFSNSSSNNLSVPALTPPSPRTTNPKINIGRPQPPKRSKSKDGGAGSRPGPPKRTNSKGAGRKTPKRTNSKKKENKMESVRNLMVRKSVRMLGNLVQSDLDRPIFDVCTGRSREWYEEHVNCESLGLVKQFYQASFGTKTNGKTQKVHVFTMVLNDEWNDLVTRTTEIQDVYIGKNTSENAKPSLRDRAAQALVSPMQAEPIALFFAPKKSKGSGDIYYVGHWKVIDGKMLAPPRPVKGQMRQCLVRLKFVGLNQDIVDAISKET